MVFAGPSILSKLFSPPHIPVWGLRGAGGEGWKWAHSISQPWVPYQLSIDTYLLQFLSYLAGFKNVSIHPSDPDTTTITALEAIASLRKMKFYFLKYIYNCQNSIQEGPSIGGAVRNATSLIPQRQPVVYNGI